MMLVFADNPKREYAYGPAGGLPDSKVVPFSQTFYVEAVQGLDRHQHEEGQVSREKDYEATVRDCKARRM
jgi:hypothetical protein